MSFQIDEKKRQKTISVLSRVRNLPSIPKVLFEVTKLLNDPKTATSKLAELITKDQGLTTKILSIANSPLYGIRREISSVEFALLILGSQEIKNIVTALSLADSMKLIPSKNFDPEDFWRHSMVVGTAAKGISQDLGFNFGSDAFVAGILHDMGILVIYNFMKDDFEQIVSRAQSGELSIIEAEYEVLGISHQEVGKFLAEKWGLPLLLCDTLNYHHVPSKGTENKFITSIVHLADYMTQKLGIAEFYWDNKIQLDQEVLEMLNFKVEDMLASFIESYRNVFRETSDTIRL